MSELDITPPLGLQIPGGRKKNLASGIMEPEFAKAVYIDDGEQAIALVVIDTIGIEQQEVTKIRHRINELTGLPTTNIMVSATHNHRAGPVYELHRTVEESQYIDDLVLKTADAVVIAKRNQQPAKIAVGLGKEKDISFNRRFFLKDGTVKTHGFGDPNVVKPAGPIDPDVQVIRIDNKAGQPIGVITNFACHLNTVSGSEYCPDFPAELSRVLKQVLGPQVVSLFSVGASANINHVDISSDQKTDNTHYLKMGRILAGEVLKVREKIDPVEKVKVGAYSETFTAETRIPSDADIETSEAILQEVQNGSQKYSDKEIFNAKQPRLIRELKLFSQEMEVQTFRIGVLVLAGFPGELFVEFGLELKQKSLAKFTMVQTHSNGISGYIVTHEAMKQGGYETGLTNRTRHYPETGYRMIAMAEEHVKRWFSEDIHLQKEEGD